jgi:hypothetical protein
MEFRQGAHREFFEEVRIARSLPERATTGSADNPMRDLENHRPTPSIEVSGRPPGP